MTAPRKPQIDLDLDYIDKLKAIGMSEKSIPDVTFTFADYQCLERLMNIRDITVEDDLKAFLQSIYEKDNEKLVSDVVEVIHQELRPIDSTLRILTSTIKDIASDICVIKGDINSIKGRLDIIEKRLDNDDIMIAGFEKRLKAKAQKIEALEKEVKVLKPDLIEKLITEIKELDPIVKRLVKTQSWWNISLRIAIAVAISTIFALVLHYNM